MTQWRQTHQEGHLPREAGHLKNSRATLRVANSAVRGKSERENLPLASCRSLAILKLGRRALRERAQRSSPQSSSVPLPREH